MSENNPKRCGLLSTRRLVLLATVAGLGASVLFTNPGFTPRTALPGFGSAAIAAEVNAQNVARPVGFADIVEKVKPAVIGVRVRVEGDAQNMGLSSEQDLPFPPGSPMERFFRRFGMPDNMAPDRNPRGPRHFNTAQGSGFFISADGYAVTNNHVVERGKTVEIQTDDGKTYTAKVVGTDPKTDLALLKIDGRNDFPYVKLADASPRIGDWVLAVGNPFGLGGTVTAGIVSARGRDIGAGPYDDFIQIDAPINRGNSGGPTFDVSGNVIGVNTAIFSPSGGSVGIAFAIPAETVKTVVAQLKDRGSVTRGWIGVQIQPLTAEIAETMGVRVTQGALVAEPQPGSPAEKAGILAGDVITAVNGEAVKDARDLAKRIGAMAPGTSIKLTVLSKGSEKTVTLTLGELPGNRQASMSTDDQRDTTGADRFGLTLAPAGSRGPGVVVTNVEADSQAAERGFHAGDVILEVSGKAVSTPADVRKALADARSDGKNSVLVRLKSEQGTRFVTIPLNRA